MGDFAAKWLGFKNDYQDKCGHETVSYYHRLSVEDSKTIGNLMFEVDRLAKLFVEAEGKLKALAFANKNLKARLKGYQTRWGAKSKAKQSPVKKSACK